MWIWLLIYLHFLKRGRIGHLPSTFRVRDTMPVIFSHCLLHCGIVFCLWEVKYKRLLAWIATNWACVECICSVICSSVPIQECSWRHFHFSRWKHTTKYLNSKTPWNRNGPALWFVIADGLLHEPCWVKLHWYGKPLEGFYPSHIREDWLNHIKVVQRHQWSHRMGCKKAKEIPIHIILFQKTRGCQYES